MSWQDNPITKAYDGSFYIVLSTANAFPYSVVPLSEDPQNKYDFDEVAAFWAALADDDPRKLTGDSPPVPDPPTDDEVMAGYRSQVVSRLNTFAATRSYEGTLDCISYYHSAGVTRAAHAVYMITARDDTWAAWDALVAGVDAGTTAVPATWEDVETLLPVLAWPD